MRRAWRAWKLSRMMPIGYRAAWRCCSGRPPNAIVGHLPDEDDQPQILLGDFIALGEAFIELYLQGLNGVVCDPGQEELGRLNCRSCHNAWAKGTNVLKKYDPRWGNTYRSGGSFQPGEPNE